MRIVIAMLVAMVLLSAWAPSADAADLEAVKRARAEGFSDLAVEWQARRDGERLVVTGQVTNLWPYRLRNLELRLRLIGYQGDELGRTIVLFLPIAVHPNTGLPFALAITVPEGKRPARLEFLFDYLLLNDGEEGIPSFYGFDAELPGLP